jgi:transcriptional regulator with XRE-family HTH domain
MNYSKIKFLADEKKITLKQICANVEITEQGLQRMFLNNSMKIETMEKIAKVLQVPVSYFFEDDNKEVSKKINAGDNNVISIGNKNNNNTNTETKDLAVCRKEVEGLKKEIELLKEMNEMLKERK